MSSLLVPHNLSMPQGFSYEETASSFIGNALGKAAHLYSISGKPSLADDSGIVIDALDGAPGIYSARYGSDVFGRPLDASEKNHYVLDQLKGIPHEKRTARFVCAIALILDRYRKFIVQETVEGYIADTPNGDGGFGYDPIFLVGETGRCMAELDENEKNSVSHRGMAAKRILAIIHQIEQTEVLHVC